MAKKQSKMAAAAIVNFTKSVPLVPSAIYFQTKFQAFIFIRDRDIAENINPKWQPAPS